MSKPEEKIKEILEKEDREAEEAEKLFNINDFTGDTDKTQVVKAKGIGTVKFKHLSLQDIIAAKKQPAEEQGYYMLYQMLNKADPTVTYEKVLALPLKVINSLFDAIKPLDFL